MYPDVEQDLNGVSARRDPDETAEGHGKGDLQS